VSEFEGHIWVAQDNDNIHLICIRQRQKNKIHGLSEKGRDLKINEDKLLWQHPAQASSAEAWADKVTTIQNTINRLRSLIDIHLLWESALELELSEIEDLAELYFSEDIQVEHLAAVWRVLSADKLHFKRKMRTWEARSPVQVQELKQQREREQARAKAQEIAEKWLLMAANTSDEQLTEVSEEAEEFVSRLEKWLDGRPDKDVGEWVTKIADKIKSPVRQLAFDVLQKARRLPEDADRDLIIANLKPEFPDTVNTAADNLQVWLPSAEETVQELAFSIDDDNTLEVDDALAIVPEGENWRILISIADPARLIELGDELDKEAMKRGTTVYLANRIVFMLPPQVSCNLASLNVDAVRSSLIISATINAQGEIIASNISREPVRVKQRLNYDQADEYLAADSDAPISQQLQALHKIAEGLHRARQTEHTLHLKRPEYKVRVTTEGEIIVYLMNRSSPSRFIVAEMMVLANYLSAQYAQQHEVPIIYRTQDIPQEPITPDMVEDPLSFYRLRKLLRSSTLSLLPDSHSGLGLSVYTQLTSPLRRFADLVMQRQLVAHLTGAPSPYDQQELYKVLETAERTAREARRVEQDSKRRWFLRYLQQQCLADIFPVIILDIAKAGYKVEIQPWGVDAFLSTSEKLTPGQQVETQIDKIRIKQAQIRLKLAKSNAKQADAA